jgi:hypothetical protein
MVGLCDPEGIARDCLQLWAEACVVYDLTDIDWRDAERLAVHVHTAHKISDAWTPIVDQWLDTPGDFEDENSTPRTREFLRANDVLIDALRFDAKSITKREEMRIGKVLQALGYVRDRRSVNKKQQFVWLKPE